MHRNVDLHYQYLTSSYACMLSCPISLRPFVILEGTGLGPWGAQGQSEGGGGGVVSPAPMWVGWEWSTFRTVSTLTNSHQETFKRGVLLCCDGAGFRVKRNVGKARRVGVASLSKMKNIYLKKKKQLPPIRVHNHLFLASVKLAANQHLVFIYWELRSECQCVGIRSFLCHYREISVSS